MASVQFSPRPAPPPLSFPRQAPPSSVAPLKVKKASPTSNTFPAGHQAPPSIQLPPRLEQLFSTSGVQAALAPIPSLFKVSNALAYITQASYDHSRKVLWCRHVLFLVERHQFQLPPRENGPAIVTSPAPARIEDPTLQRLVNVALPLILQLTSEEQQRKDPLPRHVPEALFLRATCEASGAYPQFIPVNPRMAFAHFEQAARTGHFEGWFRLGRDFEAFGNFASARGCFETGAKNGVASCLYRIGMAHLLGQLGLPTTVETGLAQLHRAASYATVQTPEPAYVYGMLLLDEFPEVSIAPECFTKFLSRGSSPRQEARRFLERAAHLGYAPAQVELGQSYEYAVEPYPFDAVLSVQYYWLASQQGDVEAHMALSKWFLCGSEEDFDKDEVLAYLLAQKAALRGLPSAEFAMGYYTEVGIGCSKDIEVARTWYTLAAQNDNDDAKERLRALSQPAPVALSRHEHETITDAQLVRKRTLARERSRAVRSPRAPAPPLPSASASVQFAQPAAPPGTEKKMRRPRTAPDLAQEAPAQASSSSRPRRSSGSSCQTNTSMPRSPGHRPVHIKLPRPLSGHHNDAPAPKSSRVDGFGPRPDPPRNDGSPRSPRSHRSIPQTFQDMGFKTKSHKLKEKECVIM